MACVVCGCAAQREVSWRALCALLGSRHPHRTSAFSTTADSCSTPSLRLGPFSATRAGRASASFAFFCLLCCNLLCFFFAPGSCAELVACCSGAEPLCSSSSWPQRRREERSGEERRGHDGRGTNRMGKEHEAMRAPKRHNERAQGQRALTRTHARGARWFSLVPLRAIGLWDRLAQRPWRKGRVKSAH
jgi:hypothetical protein